LVLVENLGVTSPVPQWVQSAEPTFSFGHGEGGGGPELDVSMSTAGQHVLLLALMRVPQATGAEVKSW
jgi:hypothetical protein